MAALLVTSPGNTDFRGGATETNVDDIYFQAADGATAIFDQTQFGAGLISDTVTLVGNSEFNRVKVQLSAAASFSAAGWILSPNWGLGGDTVQLFGSTGSDTITGTSRDDDIATSSGSTNGIDEIDAGAGDDKIQMSGNSFAAGTTVDGGFGFDEVTSNGLNDDLRAVAFSNVERLTIQVGTAILTGSQIGSSGFTQLFTQANTTATLRVLDSDVDLSGLSGFGDWGTNDAISIEGTSVSSNLLVGSSRNDTITGVSISLDTMTGGGGADTLNGGRGADNFRYFAGSEVVAGEEVHGDLGADALSLFNTGAIDFSVATLDGVETLDFVSGNSTATFRSNQLIGTALDTVSGSGGVDGLIVTTIAQSADLSNMTFSAWTDGVDTITILGSALADTLTGSARNDTLDGGASADQMGGGGGNDTYIVDASSDSITEGVGQGVDQVRSSSSFTLDMAQEVEALALTGGAAINGTGNGLANTITGNDAANSLKGLNGNDTIDGAGGIDTADYSDKTQGVEIILNGAAAAAVKVNGANEDSIRNVENIVGGSASDRLIGDTNANSFVGGGGNDTFNGAGGSDTLDGGAGVDTAEYHSFQRVEVEVTLNGAIAAIVKVDGIAEDAIEGIENIITAAGNDRLIGDSNDNNFSSGGGDDFLRGGLGHDTLNGSTGADTADYSDKTQMVKVVLKGEALATAEVNGAFEDSLQGIENIIGGSAADKLTGDEGANSFKGLGGRDTINGGAGSDHADYSDKTKKVEVNLKGATGTTVKVNGVAEDTLKKVEGVTGGSAADKLIGDGEANSFKGMKGKDTIDGAAGLDTADFSDKTKKLAIILNGATAVTVKVNGVNDDSIKNIENIVGGSAGDKLVGDSQANIFKGLGGVDTINGGAGLDTADFSDKVTAVEVALNGSTAVSVKIGGVAEDSIKNVENLVGGSAGDKLTGDAKANIFKGLGGQDTIDGGAGVDTADYSDKTGLVAVALNGATTVVVSGDGDFIKNIEHVIGGSGNDLISGDGSANRLEGGGGKDQLKGGDGKDTLIGGTGDDTMDGGLGADRFVFNSALSTTSFDIIAEFVHDKDIIQLDDAIFKKIGPSLTAGEFHAAAGAVAAHDKDDRIVYDLTTGKLFFDVDGKGGAAAVQFATLNSRPAGLDAHDFIIV
jgi:Ca2+-binding RTX toxin-like protein